MKVLIRQFLGVRHSWSFIGHALATSFLKAGHEVDLFSTDGTEHIPAHLRSHLIGYRDKNNQISGKEPSDTYDLQFSYTAPHNAARYLSNGKKNRFLQWTYEWNSPLPQGYAKQFIHADFILPPSQFSKQIFLNSGTPDSAMRVISHGISPDDFASQDKIPFKTKKSFKILANIVQLHSRKNIKGLLEAYGKAFTKKDDVCLILKAKPKLQQHKFEIDLNKLLNDFAYKFPNRADVILYGDFVENIATIYNAVDAVFTMTHCEGFYLPALESLAAGKINIAPAYGGQLDFLTNDNSLLITGKEVRADPNSMYWQRNGKALWFQPDIDDAVDKLRYAYDNFETLNQTRALDIPMIKEKYSWDNITKQIMDLCK
jgi:glycosyltransferase involved in cell wall biosynthesis